MKQKSWWAYIPDVCEAGVVVEAYTLEEAERIASDVLSKALRDDWAFNLHYTYSTVVRKGFFMYELGPLHHCNFTEEEEE